MVSILGSAELARRGNERWHDGAMSVAEPLVLGIESSCDETGIAIVRGNTLLADVTASSMAAHAQYGGIIPEIAARAHVDEFVPTLQEVLARSDVALSDLDAIAVTAGPGLVGSLTVGASGAKALTLATGKPLYGVNHVLAHACVDQLVHGPFPKPVIALIVSGGHTSLLLINDIAGDIVELGSTLDDAAGEAFDKVGRLLGLPYPGGPHVDNLAQYGDPDAIKFPRGLSAPKFAKTHPYDFSFSGLKTAVARYLESVGFDDANSVGRVRVEDSCIETTGSPDHLEDQLTHTPPLNLQADVAASFAQAVVDVLTTKAIAACRAHGVDTLVIGGGFSANSQLRELAATRCAEADITLRIPPPRFCTDNGAMIAALGSAVVAAGREPSPLDFSVTSALDLDVVVV